MFGPRLSSLPTSASVASVLCSQSCMLVCQSWRCNNNFFLLMAACFSRLITSFLCWSSSCCRVDWETFNVASLRPAGFWSDSSSDDVPEEYSESSLESSGLVRFLFSPPTSLFDFASFLLQFPLPAAELTGSSLVFFSYEP